MYWEEKMQSAKYAGSENLLCAKYNLKNYLFNYIQQFENGQKFGGGFGAKVRKPLLKKEKKRKLGTRYKTFQIGRIR
jgi:hypothetical protein